jgi:MFS family permease
MGWRTLALAAAVCFMMAIANAPTPLYPGWESQWNLTSSDMMWVFGAAWIAMVPAMLVGGRAGDRYGSRPVLILGAFSGMMACLVFLFADGLAALVAARAFGGIAVATAVAAGVVAISEAAPRGAELRAIALGSVTIAVGVGLGPLLAGLVAIWSQSPRVPVFAILGGLQIAALTIGLLATRTGSSAVPTASEASGEEFDPHASRRALRRAIAVFVPGLLATSAVVSLMPSMLVGVVGASAPTVAGLVAATTFGIGAATQPLMRRLGTEQLVVAGGAAVCASMAAMVAYGAGLDGVATAVALAVLAGCGFGISQLAAFTLVAHAYPSTGRSHANARLNAAGYVLVAVLPLAAGYVIDAYGLNVAVLAYGVVVGGGVIAMLATVPRALLAEPSATRLGSSANEERHDQ